MSVEKLQFTAEVVQSEGTMAGRHKTTDLPFTLTEFHLSAFLLLAFHLIVLHLIVA